MSSSRGIDRGKGTTFSRSTRIETYVVDREKKLPFPSAAGRTEMGKTIVDKQFDERERKKKKKTGGRRGNFSIFYNLVEFV